jgi:CHAT domain-containing protein/tetratricopeptide (TPR) repeat protein
MMAVAIMPLSPRPRRSSPRPAVWLLTVLAATPALAQERAPGLAFPQTATSPSIRSLLDAGRYPDAEQAALSLVHGLEPAEATRPLELADAIDLLLEARRRANHASAPGTVDYGQRGLRLKEAGLGPEDPGIATTLHELGYILRLQRRTREARPLVERALAIREQVFGADAIQAAATRQLLALTDLDVRDFVHAEEHLRRALAVAERVEGPQGLLVASTCYFLGVAASFQADFDASVTWLRRAIDIFEAIRGPDHPDLAPSLDRFASSNEALGDLQTARQYFERAIRLTGRTTGATQAQYFRLLEFAILLDAMGDTREAIARGDEALSLAERLQGPESAGVAIALQRTATFRHGIGDYEGARTRIDRAMAIWRTLGGSGQHVGEALGELAALSESEGRLGDAISLADQAVASLGGAQTDDRIKSIVLETRGRILTSLGRYAEARTTLDEARRLSESSTDGELRSLLAQALLSLALVDQRLGRLDEARAAATRAIELFSAYQGADHPNVAAARGRYAEVLAASGATAQAWPELEATERLAVAHVRLIGGTLPEREALRYLRERPSGLGLALTLATRADAGPDTAARAWQVVAAGRGVVLDELAARQHDIVTAGTPAVRERLDAFVRARTRLANLVVRGPEDTPLDRYKTMLAEARERRAVAEQALADVSQPFRAERARNGAGLPQILSRLSPGQALVAYVRYDRVGAAADRAAPAPPDARPGTPVAEYAAFVAVAGGAPRLVRLGPAAQIEQRIGEWRAQIDAEIEGGGIGARRLEAAYRRVGAALRRQIWDPLAPSLRGATSVFVVADGALHLVDLAALPVGTTRYLIESGPTLHHLLAERDLIRVEAAAPGRGLLVMGAPDFNQASSTADDRLVQRQTRPTPAAEGALATDVTRGTPSRSPSCEPFTRLSFRPLGDAGREARTVSDLWRASRAAGRPAGQGDEAGDMLELTGRIATETAFKTLAPGRRVVHLATHGFFLDGRCGTGARRGPAGQAPGAVSVVTADDSPLLRAGLALAGANRRTAADADRDDGILTAEEVAAVNLAGVEWAVLSACNTGVGDWVAGEGVLGLRRAFEMAGAHTVIMSLWPVGDATTASWMARLYRQRFVARARTLEAVRAASLGLLRDARARGASTHPARWAGFIAAGDWR